jgi:hypothetical protein
MGVGERKQYWRPREVDGALVGVCRVYIFVGLLGQLGLV